MTKSTVTWMLRLAGKLFTVALYVVTLLTAYGGYVNPHLWALPSIGVLFFPYFAMLTLIASVAWLIGRRFVIGCVGIGVLLACGPTFTAALPFRFANDATDESNTFKMVTFNCLHMKDIQAVDSSDPKVQPKAELNRSLQFLIGSGADFICLQELYGFGRPEIPEKYNPQIDSLLKIYPYVSTDGGRELEFASKYPFTQVEVNLGEKVKYGNCAAYRLNIDGRPLTVVNVHLSSYLLSEDERKIITEAGSQEGMKKSIKEFEGTVYQKMGKAFEMRAEVSAKIAEFAAGEKGNVIVCGDFNDVPGSWTYRNFIKHGFEDAYAQTGFGHLITYNEHMMWFHIDQILYKGELVPLYVRKERLNASDHYPLVAEFEFL